MSDNLIFKDEAYSIVGAAMEVYNHLGPGFLEAVYQESLELELASRQIPYISQPQLPITDKGQLLETHYSADLLVPRQMWIYAKISVHSRMNLRF